MPDVDATVFTGEHDHFVPVAANQRVADSFKNGRFIAVPDADHMIHVEKFRTMIDIVLGAVKGELDGTAQHEMSKAA